jgi:hypothetical protein
MRIVGLEGRPARGRPDEEHATTVDSVLGSSTLAPSHIHTTGHRVSGDDALALFRLMLGITAAPHLGFTDSPLRPADNVGLYARVVRSEQTSKDNYRVFSAAINACYFAQIIVAAALTALGAANADNKAITAFGAINTVIAGFLSYLKGSGYPARFKHNAAEWKKVREFIEHRERDFSLEGCTLDVYEVVDAIREMYDNTKRDIQMNAPEGYSPKVNIQTATGVDTAKAEAIAGKLRGLEDTFKKLRSHASGSAVDLKSDDVLAKARSLGETAQKLGSQVGVVSGGVDVKAHADDVVGKLRPGVDDAAQKLSTQAAAVSESVETKSADVMARLRRLEDTLDKVKSSVERTVEGGQEAAHTAAHDAAQSVTHAIQEKEKGVAGELRSLGKAVSMEIDERRPKAPREVSITLSNRDGTMEAEASVKK